MTKIQDTNNNQISIFNNQTAKPGIFWLLKNWLLVISWLLIIGYWLLPAPASSLDNPQERVEEVIREYIVSACPEYGGLKARVTFKFADKIFESLRECGEDVSIKVADVSEGFRPVGNVIFPIEVRGDGIDQKLFIRARVEIFEEIVVARNKIKRGDVIKEEDLALEERDIAMLAKKYFVDPKEAAGSEAKITISQNAAIFENMTKEVPLIHRGEKATIVVKGEGLLLKTEGTALADGYLGDQVKVKRADSKKTLEGIIVSPGEVEVKL